MSGKKLSLSKRIHYRLVMGPVGYGLRQFKGTEELLHASYDVLQGSLYDCSRLATFLIARYSHDGRTYQMLSLTQRHQSRQHYLGGGTRALC